MTMPAWLDKLCAILTRDLLTAVRYRTGFALAAMGTLAELAAFYYLSRAVGSGFRPEGQEYFPFLLVGTGFYTFLVVGVNAFLTTVEEAQRNGTLEVLMTSATAPVTLLCLSAVSAFAASTVNLLLYLGAGFVIFGAVFQSNVAATLLMFGLSLALAVSIGVFAAALQVATQRGSAVIWVLSSGLWFLTGTMFPVSSLPKPLRVLSDALPITHALRGMRMALLQDVSLNALARDAALLALFCAVLLPLSLVVFTHTLKRARMEGTLSFY
jgi:ABC-2 type transport system permease protein